MNSSFSASQSFSLNHPLSRHSSVYDFSDDFKQSSSRKNQSGWLKYELKQQRKNFTKPHTIRLWIGTWNTAGKPPKSSLKAWLPSSHSELDIIVFGFQEVDMSTDAFLSSDPKLTDSLYKHIINDLDSPFECIAKLHLIGLFLFVFVKPDLLAYIQHIETGIVGCGIMGVLGNKGAVAVRFQAFDSQLCFVNSHLASGLNQTDRRNNDFHEIKKRLTFKSIETIETKPFDEQDYMIFWFGDLNYRITGSQSEVLQIMKGENSLKELLARDQLLDVLKKGVAFNGFHEALISFEPTYKYDIGTSNFDSSEKRRTPAWCDRILWCYLIDSTLIENISYQSHQEYVESDHKPVSSVFQVQLDIIEKEQYENIVKQILRLRDQMENNWVPEVSVSKNQLNFEQVKLGKLFSKTLTLTNKGKLPVNWFFAKKINSDSISEPWTWADPLSGHILPGESSQVSIYLQINFDTAAELNQLRDPHFSDIFVLRLVNGRDYFISVEAIWTPTSFARPLEELCKDSSIPNILLQLTTSLLLHKENSNLFHTLVSETELEKALETIELIKVEVLDQFSPACLAKLLIFFLQYCPVPVIPESFHSSFQNASNTKFMELVSDLPPVHRSVLLHLLQFAVQFAGSDPTHQKEISEVLGPLTLRDNKPSKSGQKSQFFHSWMQIFIDGM